MYAAKSSKCKTKDKQPGFFKKKKKRQRKDKTKKQKGKEPGGKTYEPYQQNASMDSDSNKPRTNERRTKPGQLEPVVTIL